MSEIINRVQTSGKSNSMDLIFFPLALLILVGLFSNELSASALNTTPILPTPFCTGLIEPGECYPTNVNGCDTSVSNCNLTASTKFSFLNSGSPFTALFSGNIAQFANTFTAASQSANPTSQPFAFFPNATTVSDGATNQTGANTFYVGCLNDNDTLWHLVIGNNEQLNCWQFFSNDTQVPLAYSKLYNGQLPPTPNNANLNCTVANDATTTFTYQFIGCDNLHNDNQSQTLLQTKTLVLAFNSTTIQNAPNSGNASKTGVFLYGWAWMPNEQNVYPFNKKNSNSMQVCVSIAPDLNYGVSQTTSCQAATTSIHQTICASASGTAACNQSTGVGAFLLSVGLIAGIVFLILGLGLGLNIGIFTAAFGISSNDQGTKLMQALGIGLISWTFLYSEFGGWISILPLGLNFIAFSVLTLMYFFGLYWRVFSWD